MFSKCNNENTRLVIYVTKFECDFEVWNQNIKNKRAIENEQKKISQEDKLPEINAEKPNW